jgi:alkanesulfonate monooxygenase SsuD/methylene tetrahydromethanopterin reductase-like flavin-dependent oxidoreductase (luciferase family)
MRIGISPFGTSRESVLRIARSAADAGIDTFWLGDGLLENADFPMWSGGLESFTELAWLAGRFPGASLGCTAAVLPLRDPLWLAKQAATLDRLADGRFTLVVTPGFWRREFAFRGLDYDGRGKNFERALAKLRAALAGSPEAAESTGPDPGRVSPRPTDLGGPPLWLAGAAPTLRRALELGLPFQASRMSPAALAPWAERWWDSGGTTLAVRIRLESGDRRPRGEALEWNALTGPPAFLADQLHAYADLGVSDVSIVPGQEEKVSLATIEALGAIHLP